MMIASRNGMVVRNQLPYDAEVEYLESTGTQYIDTGKYITVDTVISIGIRVVTNAWNVAMFGASNGAGLTNGEVSLLIDPSRFIVVIPTGTSSSTYLGLGVPYSVGTDYEIEYASGECFVNGVRASLNAWPPNYVPARPTYLFAANRGSAQAMIKARIWSFKMGAGTEDVLDFIPVRFTNEQGVSEGAMYDRLGVGGMNPDGSPRTDGLYRNRGTGAFVFPTA